MKRLLVVHHLALVLSSVASFTIHAAVAQEPFIPRRQSAPPGPPLDPAAAIEKMTVPEGFAVELVASEPDLLNPVAMAFDDRGRIYVTESFEYPRHEPGPGRDRVKILEDTDQDGRVDKVTIFAEGLNIPSGIAVGHGGVWVANAPDILFLEDTDGDDRADRTTVVATGFGRDDTHELPNALTWGPDGFLYGLNGVFNRSVVKQDDRVYDFTCAMFRIDPVTKRFDLFCEGTSNPWGITFDNEGSAFISACVIDHLWHLTETGYYHRQGGPYPPHTWKIESIVDYKHQMAAYCGIEYFDSPAYPAEYRNKLYMGNIHGGCINVDSVHRNGATYRGKPHDDFLTANDVWFMPVAQKVGPDGCLYILDWYDRYHCYQDASADPEGVDRGHGRLYRVVYGDRPAIVHPDVAKMNDQQLVELLADPNIYYRQRAAVVLSQRLRSDRASEADRDVIDLLTNRVLAGEAPVALLQLTTLLYAPALPTETLRKLLDHSDPLVVSWAVRAAATRGVDDPAVQEMIRALAAAEDPRVRLQVAIASSKMASQSRTDWLIDVLRHSQDDALLPRIVWQNLEPRIAADQKRIVGEIASHPDPRESLLTAMAPRIATRLLSSIVPDMTGAADHQSLASVLKMADGVGSEASELADQILESVVRKVRTGEIRRAAAKDDLQTWVKTTALEGAVANQLRALAGDRAAIEQLTANVLNEKTDVHDRTTQLETLALVAPETLEQPLDQWLQSNKTGGAASESWQSALIGSVIAHGPPKTVQKLVDQMASLPVGLQATIAERLSQRETTSLMLLDAIIAEKMPRDAVSPNQIRTLARSPSDAVREKTAAVWGTVRTELSKTRQPVVEAISRFLLDEAKGDASRGVAVYDRICGQCHVMHQRGHEVGPNITRNGRGNFEQLIVSVFDPSLVIGDAFKSVTVLTVDGRVINGIVTEQSDQRLVLKIQGGKDEVIPSDDIESLQRNPQSLMPEGLEDQMSPQEMADLFALLSLENPPDAPTNQPIPGTPAGLQTR
jgi:putative membrane-bound dehydrogenase-like protein